jgi:hypothetical protein
MEPAWPSSLLNDPSKQPTVVESVEEFIDQVFYGNHMHDIVVLRDGLRKMNQYEAMPPCVRDVKGGVRDFLDSIDDSSLEELRGKIYYMDEEKEQLSVSRNEDGTTLDNLLLKRNELRTRTGTQSLYITEMRKKTKYRHPKNGEWAKSMLEWDIKDFVGKTKAEMMAYWDRYDEGVFVGEKYSGSPLHCDQVLWSNVGKNWQGEKLLAVWPYGKVSNEILEEFQGELFVPPLSQKEEDALRKTSKLAVVSPGDIFLFSGAVAHMALNTSSTACITAYESIINLNKRHIEVFLDTGTENHFKDCRMEQEDLENVKLDVADQMYDAVDHINRGNVTDPKLISAVLAVVESLKADEFLRGELEGVAAPPRKQSRTENEEDPWPPPSDKVQHWWQEVDEQEENAQKEQCEDCEEKDQHQSGSIFSCAGKEGHSRGEPGASTAALGGGVVA